MRGTRRRMRRIALVGMLALAGGVAGSLPAQGGESQARFRAVLRIDAALVRRDLERQNGVTVEPASAPASTRSVRAAAPRVLPRAGGGVCVRRWIGRTRFRWVCK